MNEGNGIISLGVAEEQGESIIVGSHRHEPAFVQGEARYRDARKVTVVGAVVNIVLSVIKILAGWLGASHALIADGIHSLSDLATDAVVLLAAKHGARDADEEHPYGHGRIETLATVVLGIVLILVALGIGYDAVRRLFEPKSLLLPGMLSPAKTVSYCILRVCLGIPDKACHRFHSKAATYSSEPATPLMERIRD